MSDPASIRMVPRQVGDVVRDLVIGQEDVVEADNVVWIPRLNEMHATQDMLDRVGAEVERQMDRKVLPLRTVPLMLRLLLYLVPTAALQEALSSRRDVETYRVDPNNQRTFKLCGPCVVTVNRD